MKYIDVSSADEIPEPPTPRPLFIEQHENTLDESMHPIYKNQGLCVRQDSSHPVPGFYIVSPTSYFKSLDQMDRLTHLRLFLILQEVRKGMRETLGIEHIHLYYEERAKLGSNVHYWLLPIYDIKKHPRIYHFDIKQYLDSFPFEGAREKIVACNIKMRSYLEGSGLLRADEKLLSQNWLE
ncbi:hypothetical protein WDW86_07645 [Bdellovibrionota bacterium FG-2]